MKNTNPIFSLKNFRSFGEEGADFELAPITVLTGCNSAGKSSLVKALLLVSSERILEGMSKEGKKVEEYFPATELKLSSKKLSLGRYDKVLNDNSEDGKVVMAYKMWSYYLQEEVVVKMSYEALPGVLNDGGLSIFSIEKMDGMTIWSFFRNDSLPLELGGTTKDWDTFDEIDDNWKKYMEVNYYNYLFGIPDYGNGTIATQRKIFVEGEAQNKLTSKDGKPIEELCQFFHIYNLLPENNHLNNYLYNQECREKKMSELKEQLGSVIDDYELTPDWRATFNFDNPRDINEKWYALKNRKPEQDAIEELLEDIREDYNRRVQNECILPWFLRNIAYIESSSATVKRLYTAEDDNKMWLALSELVRSGRTKTSTFVNHWLYEFGITDNEKEDCIELENTEEGVGILVYLNKGGKKRLLADEGYGITQLLSLLLQIDNIIKKNINTKEEKRLSTDFIDYDEPHTFIAIEEPEIHLHPKYQSLLADLFVEAYKDHHIHFIIETHSEYLIRKLQVLVAEKKLKPSEVSLNYVDKDKKGVSHNRQIEIQEDGGLSESLGSGFFDESDRLAIDLFRLKPIMP